MANLWSRTPLYRLEQLGTTTSGIPNFALNIVTTPDIQALDIKRIDPVNVLGGADIGNFPYLYSRVTLKQAGEQQEAYSLLTVLQWQILLNS